MRQIGAIVLVFGLMVGFAHRSAQAFPPFQKQFAARYVGDESTDSQKSIAALVKTAKCNVCHDPKPGPDGKASKKNRNAYGMALDKLLSKADMKDEAKIQKALETVEGQKAEGADTTFGEALKAGKLPVAE